MPTGKGKVDARSFHCKGEFSEQDEWKESQPHSDDLRSRVKAEIQEILEFVDGAAGKKTYEAFEEELIPRVLCLGRLLIALFLCLWEERTPITATVVRGKEEHGRQPAKSRLLGTYFGKVRYWRTYLLQRNGDRGGGYYPVDLALGLTADGFSMGLLSRAMRLATKMSYAASAGVMVGFLGWSPSTKTIEEATLGLGRFTAEWVEHRPPPEGDGEVLVIQIDSKATPTARKAELKKRRGTPRMGRVSGEPRAPDVRRCLAARSEAGPGLGPPATGRRCRLNLQCPGHQAPSLGRTGRERRGSRPAGVGGAPLDQGKGSEGARSPLPRVRDQSQDRGGGRMTEAMARLKSLLAAQEPSAKSAKTPLSALLAPRSGEHSEKTPLPHPATDPAGELPARKVASPRARDNRPAVDAPAPGTVARATAGGGRRPRGDAPIPPAGRLPVALVSRPKVRPACGHAGALVVLTVKGRGQLCGDCWRRWVRGRLNWPGGTRGQA